MLARTPDLTAGQLSALLAAAGDELERALGARVTQRVELAEGAQQFLASPDEAAVDADLAWLSSSGVRIVLACDPEYPPLLREMPGAPAALYVEGSVAALSSPQIAMVGSRNPTAAGRSTAREWTVYRAGDGKHLTPGVHRGARGDQRAAVPRRLHDERPE